jgi:hypothetical protein
VRYIEIRAFTSDRADEAAKYFTDISHGKHVAVELKQHFDDLDGKRTVI